MKKQTDVLLMAVGPDKRARRHLIQNISRIIQKGKRLGTVSLRPEKEKIDKPIERLENWKKSKELIIS